ncbi:hypothetical protein V8E51_008625 [Hyaloscypha variabilis]
MGFDLTFLLCCITSFLFVLLLRSPSRYHPISRALRNFHWYYWKSAVPSEWCSPSPNTHAQRVSLSWSNWRGGCRIAVRGLCGTQL